ncbi:hypothetical protein X777_14796 [Ooceraea biroi]|uniref:Uncharacterized protein n=1 Tax=Ooceraea biroi TaxID=2015173 RepID=A0A026WRJ6_OOCBI|nr:hypothetical protein X777_14796 [Ooceraea biroi]
MSMPTKGRRDHHLSHHHHQQQQSHHVPPQHQHPIILGQPVVHSHSPQTYSAVVTTNTPRFLTNAGESVLLDWHVFSAFLRAASAFLQRSAYMRPVERHLPSSGRFLFRERHTRRDAREGFAERHESPRNCLFAHLAHAPCVRNKVLFEVRVTTRATCVLRAADDVLPRVS